MKNGNRNDPGEGKLANGSTVTENFAAWILGPEFPVTVIVNGSVGVASVGEKESRKDPLVSIDKLRLRGVGALVVSPSGEVDTSIVTIPENPDKLDSVTFVAPVWP